MDFDFSRKIPIGIQSFEKMRNDKYVYFVGFAYNTRLVWL